MHWDAAPSQWYAEPKRLAKLGYLNSEKLPGRTRPRTHYTLTDRGRAALEAWVRTPSALPRVQNEPVVRLLSGDLVPPEALLEGLAALRPQIEEQLDKLSANRDRWPEIVPHREHLLTVNQTFAEGILRLNLEWLEEAEKVLRSQD